MKESCILRRIKSLIASRQAYLEPEGLARVIYSLSLIIL